jgi:hypothetical protein
MESFSRAVEISDSAALQAPDLVIGINRVTLDNLTYRIELDLVDTKGRPLRGRLTVEASPARLVPPIEISGAAGWRTGYVVPVMSGTLGGALDVYDGRVSLDGGTGYHDHNWGFWEGVSWQWGQVQHETLAFLYGRVFPPPEAADPDNIPGFVGVLGPDGPLGYATNVRIVEQNDAAGRPTGIDIQGRGASLDMRAQFRVESMVTTPAQQGPLAGRIDFLQMRGEYTVTGTAGDRRIEFVAPGAAETFRGTDAVTSGTDAAQ